MCARARVRARPAPRRPEAAHSDGLFSNFAVQRLRLFIGSASHHIIDCIVITLTSLSATQSCTKEHQGAPCQQDSGGAPAPTWHWR